MIYLAIILSVNLGHYITNFSFGLASQYFSY